MRGFKKFMFVFLPVLCLGMAMGQVSGMADQRQDQLKRVEAVECPAVKLKHWQNSPEQERYAFLFGFVTMIEVEREWQGAKPLPANRSTVGGWVRGLSGVTLKAMDAALEQYIANNPDKLEMPVVEALGRIYVRPAMTEADMSKARERWSEIQGGDKAKPSGKKAKRGQ